MLEYDELEEEEIILLISRYKPPTFSVFFNWAIECWIHLIQLDPIRVKQHLTVLVIGWLTAWEQA